MSGRIDMDKDDGAWAELEQTVCWLNEDCIAGWHMGEIECRFPSWAEDAK